MKIASKIEVAPYIKPDGLEICLECWKSWMLSDDRDLSASRMKLDGGRDGEDGAQAYEHDIYAEQRQADNKIGAATGAMIDSLKPVHRWAIHRKCGIATVWRFNSSDYTLTAIEATQELEKKLRRNIDTGTVFC